MPTHRIALMASFCSIGLISFSALAAEPAPAATPERASANLLAGSPPSFCVTTTNAEPTAWQETLGLTQADVDKLIAWEMPTQCAVKVRYLFPVGELSGYVALALKKSSTANPYSQAYRSDYHFCVFNIASNVCSMKAVTLDGKVFDRREWQARTLPPDKSAVQ